MELLSVAEIPSNIGRYPWDPQTEIDRGHAVLTSIRHMCREYAAAQPSDSGTEVARIEISGAGPGMSNVTHRQLDSTELRMVAVLTASGGSELDGLPRIGIVPSKVIQELRGK